MRFLNPILLAGLAAVFLPIVIHLINRRRAVRVAFPALEFLRRSQKEQARRLKIKQLLLLLARISIFLLLPLAMAQPYMLCGAQGQSAGDRLPTSIVIVIDDSASMSWSRSGDTLLEVARARAQRVVRGMRSWDRAAVIFAHDPPSIVVGDLTGDRGILQRAIRSEPASFGGSDLPSALLLAREIQLDSELSAKRTVVITDDTAAAWSDRVTNPSQLAGLGDVEVIRVSPERAMRNSAVIALDYSEAAEGGAGNYEVTATIESWGYDGESEVEATLLVDDRPVGTTPVEIPADRPGTVTFTHRFDDNGLFRVAVSIEEPEGASADNTRYLPIHLDRSIRALMVNGDVRSVQYNDELFYLERALGARVGEVRAVDTDIVAPERFVSADLSAYDVVILANVAVMPVSQVQRLVEFAEEGGGILLSGGDNVDAERWSSIYADLLPKPVRSVSVLCDPNDPDANIKATRLAALDVTTPIFRVFSLPGGESIQSARVFTYLLLEPTTDESVRTLASYADGGPALLERRIGRGRVLLWTTSIDFDWTDLPIRTAYLPLMQRMVQYLARRGADASDQAVLGERVSIDVESMGAERVEVHDPDGERHVIDVVAGSAGFVPQRAGHHRVFVSASGRDTEVDALSFAANLPPSEHDPAVVAGADRDRFIDAAVGARGADGAVVDVPENRARTWPVLLFLLLVVIYAESLLAVRRRFWQRLRGRRGAESADAL